MGSAFRKRAVATTNSTQTSKFLEFASVETTDKNRDLLLAFEHVCTTADLILTHNRGILKYWYSVSRGLYEITIDEKTSSHQLSHMFVSPVVVDDDESKKMVNFVRQHVRQNVVVAIVDSDPSLDDFYARLVCTDDTHYTIRFNARLFRLKERAVDDQSNDELYKKHCRRVSFVACAVLLHLLTRTMWSKQRPIPQPPPDTPYCKSLRPEQHHATISMHNLFRYQTPIDTSRVFIGSQYREDSLYRYGKAWDAGNCFQHLLFGGEVHLEENEEDYVVLIGVTRLSDSVLIHFENNHRLNLFRRLTLIRTFPFLFTRVLIYILDEQVAYEYKPSVPIRPLLHYDNEIIQRPRHDTPKCSGNTVVYKFDTTSQSRIFTEHPILFRRLTPDNVLLPHPEMMGTLLQMKAADEFDQLYYFYM